jgi:Flp pilus assembly pilin Flp
MLKMLKPIRRDERGANLVEMALVTVLLLMLLAGVVDIGRLFNSWIVITNASREGARYAARFPFDEDGIEQAAIQEATDSGVSLYEDNIAIIELSRGPGEPIRVKVEYRFDTIMGDIIQVGAGITLTGSTEMIVFGLDT